ncbi:MAG: o-succinylbenzoate synthase [Duncaniella sp.]|nr:o-succinylbenzoate synthase [Duncaniella sp.]
MKGAFAKYTLDFRFTAITSRDRMNRKETFYIKVFDAAAPEVFGIGECALFRGLSCDDRPDYEQKLEAVCSDIDRYAADYSLLADYPSIRTGLETAIHDLRNGGRRIVFPSTWTSGRDSIVINGLVWMGDRELMAERIHAKIKDGFHCVKLKIGGINFNDEIDLLRLIRNICPDIQLRVDANGAFTPDNALERLNRLAEYKIHSIEQPIRQGQWEAMAELCRQTPIPIGLDEELIGLNSPAVKAEMLDTIRPQYIILKPTLCGGFSGSDEWIRLASERNIGWWATSALESNIGLNAISQWVATYQPTMPQGLGTGQLYHNNIPSPLKLTGEYLSYDPHAKWNIPDLEWNEF